MLAVVVVGLGEVWDPEAAASEEGMAGTHMEAEAAVADTVHLRSRAEAIEEAIVAAAAEDEATIPTE